MSRSHVVGLILLSLLVVSACDGRHDPVPLHLQRPIISQSCHIAIENVPGMDWEQLILMLGVPSSDPRCHVRAENSEEYEANQIPGRGWCVWIGDEDIDTSELPRVVRTSSRTDEGASQATSQIGYAVHITPDPRSSRLEFDFVRVRGGFSRDEVLWNGYQDEADTYLPEVGSLNEWGEEVTEETLQTLREIGMRDAVWQALSGPSCAIESNLGRPVCAGSAQLNERPICDHQFVIGNQRPYCFVADCRLIPDHPFCERGCDEDPLRVKCHRGHPVLGGIPSCIRPRPSVTEAA